MTTLLLSHPDCLGHVTPPGHPERVDRLRAVLAALDAPEFAALQRAEAPLATDADLALGHDPAYVAQIRAAIPASGSRQLDEDTHVCPGSLAAALRAAGAVIAATDAVLDGRAGNAFCAVRPPGHHAETALPMGFCLFGNVALGALHALRRRGLARVAVMDFDVHHGNGTQDLLWSEPRALFVSTHQMPLWPGTGAREETNPARSVLNIPLPPGCDGARFRRVFAEEVLPAIDAHAPELLFISAGFDAHRADPLAGLALDADDFAWATAALCDLADRHCGGRVVSTLEGGYDLDALAASAAAHVRVLMERAA